MNEENPTFDGNFLGTYGHKQLFAEELKLVPELAPFKERSTGSRGHLEEEIAVLK